MQSNSNAYANNLSQYFFYTYTLKYVEVLYEFECDL